MTHAGSQKHRDRLSGCLCRAVEQRVATAQISPQRVFGAAAVAQQNCVLLAGATAIGVVVPLGEKRAEQAVLHMEEGHVLVEGELHRGRRTAGHQGEQLLQGQVVAGGDALQPPALQEPAGRKRVGHVQGEITQAGGQGREPLKLISVANQVAVGLGPDQWLQAPGLIGPDDALTRQPDAAGPLTAAQGYGLAQLGRMLEVGIAAKPLSAFSVVNTMLE